MSERQTPLLKVYGITKTFGSVKALDNVGFTLEAGEVHCLMGENGAGKSTLAKIVAGVYSLEEGQIEFEGKNVEIHTPADAIRLGIGIVMQEFYSMPHLPVYENVFLGHQEVFKKVIVLDKHTCIKKTRELLEMFGMEKQISPLSRLSTLSVAEQQIVEIIKAVSYDSKIIILDEPTASLTSKETERLFKVVRKLKEKGIGFVIVSHRFNEIFDISDKITVLRDGCEVLRDFPMKEMTEEKLIQAMVGREIKDLYGTRVERNGECRPMLQVRNLSDSWDFIKDLSFTAYSGQILGIAGLVGAGRTTLVRCIFGAEDRKSGEVLVDSENIKANSPGDAIKKGLALVTENRKEEGLLLDTPIFINMGFAKTANGKNTVLNFANEFKDGKKMLEQLHVKAGSLRDPARSLSGGNQQKVVLAKWLLTNPKVLILDEPTRGIDISAKSEIYTILRQLAADGVCVIVVSSELPEVLGICDRVLVMKDGYFTHEFTDIANLTEEDIMKEASFGNRVDVTSGKGAE